MFSYPKFSCQSSNRYRREIRLSLFVSLATVAAFNAFSPAQATNANAPSAVMASEGSEKSSPEIETPSVEITRFDIAGRATVGVASSAELIAEIKGVKPDGEVHWTWETPEVKFSKDKPENDEAWERVFQSGDYDFSLNVTGPGTATQSWTLKTLGFYLLENKVTAVFEVDGQEMILRSK